MSGPESCRLMREHGFAGPVFGLTGHVWSNEIELFKNSSCNHVFTKPLNIENVKEVLNATFNIIRDADCLKESVSSTALLSQTAMNTTSAAWVATKYFNNDDDAESAVRTTLRLGAENVCLAGQGHKVEEKDDGNSEQLSINSSPSHSHSSSSESSHIVTDSVRLAIASEAPYASAALTGKSILVVDDSPLNLKMLQKVLGGFSSTLSQAVDGVEAVSMVREAAERGAPFDVVFMDYEVGTERHAVKCG